MKSFMQTVKLFVKTPQIIVAYLVLLAGSNVWFIQVFKAFVNDYKQWGDARTDGIYYLGDIGIIGSYVYFIFWLFISYEFFRKSKEVDIQETLDCMGARGGIFYLHQIGTLLLAVSVIVLNVFVYFIAGYFRLDFSVVPVLKEQIWIMLLVDVFLLSIASVFCGSALSQVRNRFVGYGIALALSSVMMWELLEPIAWGLGIGGDVLCFIRDFICFLPPDMSASYDALYGLPMDGYRIVIMGIWIVLGSIWILRKIFISSRRASAVGTGGCMVLIAVLGILAWDRGSVLLQSESKRSAIQEQFFDGETRKKQADFTISGYRMELRVRKELSAECKIELADGDPKEEYDFTLYHCYKVKDIRDDKGKEMAFSQDGDYVTVRGNKDVGTKEITFFYEGGSSLFYSNSHACFLTGIIPYYPKAGFQEVISDERMEVKQPNDPVVWFDIGFDIPGSVVSNLAYSEGRYKGKTDSALFVKGYLDSEYYEKTQCVCYPMQRSSYEVAEAYQNGALQQQIDQLTQYLGAEPVRLEKKQIIVIPTSTAFCSRLGSYYETDSYVLLTTGTSPYVVLQERFGRKGDSELQQVFFQLSVSPDSVIEDFVIWKDLTSDPDDYTKRDELNDRIVGKMKEVGIQEIAQKVYARLVSDGYAGDVEADIEFIKNVRKEGAL